MKKISILILMLIVGINNMRAESVTWESKEGWEAASGGFGNFQWIGVHTPGDATQLYSFNEIRMRFWKTDDDDAKDNYLAIARVSATSTLSANHVVAVSNNHLRASADNSLETFTFDDDVVLLGGTTYYLVFVQSNTPTNGSYTVRACRLTLNHTDYGEYPYGNSAGSTGANYWIYFGATLTPSPATGYCTGDILGGSMESGNWKTSWTSGTTPSFTITCPNANFNNASDKPAGGLDIRSGSKYSATYTINAPDGYIITGYKLFGNAISSSKDQTITPADGGSAVTFTSKGNSISVSGLRKATTSFTLTDNKGNTGLFLHAMQVSMVRSITSLPTENNKSYVITNARATWNFVDNATSMNAASSTDLDNDDQHIALIYYNENYYLYSVNTGKFLTADNTLTTTPTNDEQVSITATGNATYPWFLKFKNIANKNINVGGNGQIEINNWSTIDDGNRNAIIEVADLDANDALGKVSGYSDIIARLQNINWSDSDKGGQLNRYNLTGGYVGYAGHERDMLENISDGYSESNLALARNMIENYALNMPKAGTFLRLKGATSGMYVKYGEKVNSQYPMGNADEDAIFYYDGEHLLSYNSGIYWGVKGGETGVGGSNWDWTEVGGTGTTITFAESNTAGRYFIKLQTIYSEFPDILLYDRTTYCDRGAFNGTSGVTDERYTWTLEEVESLPLSIAAESYTSFSSPVPVTIPDNCYAYIATSKGTGVINMTKVTGNVPANTGLIISTNGVAQDLDFTICTTDNPTDVSGNKLVANVAADNVSKADNYFFGQVSGNYVFTKLSGDGDYYTLPGHKAYLNLGGNAARLSINWGGDDATGLMELNNENIKLNDGKYYQNGKIVIIKNGIRYNLSGQTLCR